MLKKPHVVVLDPSVRKAEIACFNHLMELSPLPLSYHLPVLNGLESLDHESKGILGIVVLGSLASVNDGLPWQAPLEKWVREKAEKTIPTLGICYGHQMIAHAFGGKVEYHQPDRKKHVGFREVKFRATPLCGEGSGKVFVSHNEHVYELPPGFESFGTSDLVAIDAMKHQTLPVYSFQPHPEAIPKFADQRIPGTSSDLADFKFGHDIVRNFFLLCEALSKK